LQHCIWAALQRRASGAGGFTKQALSSLCKYGLVTIGLIYLRIRLNGSSPLFSRQDNPASFHESTLTRMMTYSYLWVFNLQSLACPSVLSYDWQLGSVPLLTSGLDPRLLLTILASLASLALLRTVATSHSRPVLFSLLFMILPFVPASNILQTVGFVAAERTLYIPSIGWSVLVAVGWGRILARVKARVPNSSLWTRVSRVSPCLLYLATLGLLGVTAARLVLRNNVWSSRAALFRSGLASTPNNAKVWYNYGNYLRDQEVKYRSEDQRQQLKKLNRLKSKLAYSM